MKYFVANREEFIKIRTLEDMGCEVFVIDTLDNLEQHLSSIEELIGHFNSYIEWDNMFTIENVVERVKKGIIVVLTYFKHKPVGYIFIDKGWVYNLFVSKLNERPTKTFLSLCNKAFELAIERYGITAWECEDWNKPMFLVAKTSGMREINYSLKLELT